MCVVVWLDFGLRWLFRFGNAGCWFSLLMWFEFEVRYLYFFDFIGCCVGLLFDVSELLGLNWWLRVGWVLGVW